MNTNAEDFKPILVNMDINLWRRFKVCAAHKGSTVVDLVNQMISEFVNKVEGEVLDQMTTNRLKKARKGEVK